MHDRGKEEMNGEWERGRGREEERKERCMRKVEKEGGSSEANG